MSTENLWIVIPAYREAATIGSVVESLRALGYGNICVVNDGSPDNTAALAGKAGAHVLDHILNLGQGAALQTGIAYALLNGAEYICTFDADGQHAACSVGDLYAALTAARADVALGSRFLDKDSNVPVLRRLLLQAALLFTRVHAQIDVSDTHNGLRLLTRRAAEVLTIEQPGMAHASEILQKMGAAKLRFVEVPVHISYDNRSPRKGQSGFDSVKILLDLLYRSLAARR
jgi:glycosyltransferase involved in cell wall biosynthesis